MEIITSAFDKREKVYQTIMPSFGMKKLKGFCHLFNMNMEKDLKTKNGKYLLLGRIILCMIPQTIKKMRSENKEFPIDKVDIIEPSYSKGKIQESEIYVGDMLYFKLQLKCSPDEYSHVCRIEITKGKNIVFAGLFKLQKRQ